MLTKYGTDNIIVMLIIGALLLVLAYYLPRNWACYLIGSAGILLILFTFWFFRDPDRKVPAEAIKDPSLVVSPADGRIVMLEKVKEDKYMHDSAMQVSIFLSPLDVHVNRIPINGIVEYYKYNPGSYLVAYHPKSSELNEHTAIGVKTAYGRMFFKQITGILARRLVCTLKEGDTIKIGARFGMMKFGSRMDIIMPIGTDIKVKVGDRVTAGESIIAKLK